MSPTTSLQLLGLSTAVPKHTMNLSQATSLAQQLVCENEQQRKLTRVIYRRAKVANRHTCVPHEIAFQWKSPDAHDAENRGPTTAARMKLFAEHAAPLACEAGEKAIVAAGIDRAEITHLVTVCCTGFQAPGVDVKMLNALHLPPTTQRVNVGFMGCHGAINGLRTAHALARQPHATVLLCAVELCSLHYRFVWDPERMMGNALFADGAAAVICRATNELDEDLSDSDLECSQDNDGTDNTQLRLLDNSSCLIPDSVEEMSWEVGDHGFEMMLTARVPELIHQHVGDWLDQWLASRGLSRDKIDCWAVHPGGPRILDAVEEGLQLPGDATRVSREILGEYGNMSSPTILFILQRMLQQRVSGRCVAIAFGPGLVAEAMLLELPQ